VFRDWFRAHPEAIPAYVSFKRSRAAVMPDIDAYSDVKDPVVDLVIAVAETWAASAGWPPGQDRALQRAQVRERPRPALIEGQSALCGRAAPSSRARISPLRKVRTAWRERRRGLFPG
jgi:hypothetical protein